MGRILSIDYGIKRSGLAVTDPLKIIVNPLKTVNTSSLIRFIEQYCLEEKVEKIVIGKPTHFDGNPTYLVEEINRFAEKLRSLKPGIAIDFQNENFSSQQAKEIILSSGLSRKQRQDKSRIDRISAVIILQRYLKHI